MQIKNFKNLKYFFTNFVAAFNQEALVLKNSSWLSKSEDDSFLKILKVFRQVLCKESSGEL